MAPTTKKRRSLTIVGVMRLDSLNSFHSHSSPTSIIDFSFPINIHFKSNSIESLTLLDSRAITCFMDKPFI